MTAPGETGSAPAPTVVSAGESLQRELESIRRQMDEAAEEKEKLERLQEDYVEVASKIKRRAIGMRYDEFLCCSYEVYARVP